MSELDEGFKIASLDPNARVILMPVDKGVFSENAFNFYKSKIWKEGDLLILLHIYNQPSISSLPLGGGTVGFKTEDISDVITLEVSQARSFLEEYKSKADSARISSQMLLKSNEGDCEEIICNTINDVKPSLTIVGTRSMGAVARFLLGSVSDYILHHSSYPILIVPSPENLKK